MTDDLMAAFTRNPGPYAAPVLKAATDFTHVMDELTTAPGASDEEVARTKAAVLALSECTEDGENHDR